MPDPPTTNSPAASPDGNRDSKDREVHRSMTSLLAAVSATWKHYETTRNIVAFFFLGLANNFGYVIMLSAAFDLLRIIDELSIKEAEPSETGFIRYCNEMSTGAILLANIIPCTIIKLIVPFLPLWIHFRMAIVVFTAAGGLILVGLALNEICIIAGICLVSLSQGLGETSLLAYTVFFKTKHVLSTWSSGTGLAGLLGSFMYSLMRQMGLSPQTTIFCMLIMPVTMAFNFWIIVERPMLVQYEQDKADIRLIREERRHAQEKTESLEGDSAKHRTSLKENVKTIPKILVTFTIWYGLVYFFEYFINQGLFELMTIPDTFLDHDAQYRWYNTVYQMGVFISRSSMSVVSINRLYLTALFQGVNVVVFLFEAIYGYITYLPITFIIILWEGLLGGACYVNTFRLIATTWPVEGREFAMSINAIGDSVMVSIAGAVAIPVHNTLCRTMPTYGKPPYVPPTNNATLRLSVSPP